jgi:hypothetical protein
MKPHKRNLTFDAPCLEKNVNTGGDRSSVLQDSSLVLYHCVTFTLAISIIIKLNTNIFCHFPEVA